MRIGYALLVALVACGIDAHGTATTDGGSPLPPPGPPPPQADAGATFCGSLVSDTSVKGCWDFDRPPQTDLKTKFGFTNLEAGLGAGFAIEPSVDGLGSGTALRVTLAEAGGSRTARVTQVLAASPTPLPPTHVVVDVHAVVHASTVSGNLVTVDVLGAASAKFIGVGVSGTKLFATNSAQGDLTIALERPFEVKINLAIQPGGSGARTITIDGTTQLVNDTVDFALDANDVQLSLGTYFTADATGTMSASFDQLVVREP